MSSPQTVPIIDPTGKAWDIPADKAPAALQAGGKLGMSVTAPDNSKWLIPADRVHEAIAQGGKLMGAPPAAPNVPVESSGADTAMGAASKLGDAAAAVAKPVIGASAPNLAVQLYKHMRGEPNTLKDIPGDAVATFLMAGGAGEAEAAVGAAEKTAPEEAAAPSTRPLKYRRLPRVQRKRPEFLIPNPSRALYPASPLSVKFSPAKTTRTY